MTAEHLVFRRRALGEGITDPELRRAQAQGRLVRVAAGAYLPGSGTVFAATDLHRARILAAVEAHKGDVVVSHVSAAVLHGLDVGDADLDRVHLSRTGPSGGRRTPALHVHTTSFRDGEVTMIDGIAVTSPARTVVDVGRTASLDQSVVIGDCALHSGTVQIDDINEVLDRQSRRKGVASARRAVALLDGRSESPGESISRIRMRRFGIPQPDLQYVVRTDIGVFVARVDFYWEEWELAGEFDGMGKYKLTSGQSGEIVAQEKLREDAVRDTGRDMIRWVWSDLRRFEAVKERFDRACARACRRK